MNNYSQKRITDSELIKRFKEGDGSAFNLLFDRYKNQIKRISREYYYLNKHEYLTLDDIYSVCLECFFIGAKSFNPDLNDNFYSYWKRIVNHELMKLIMENVLFYTHIAFSLDEKMNLENGLTMGEVCYEKDDNAFRYDKELLVMRICEDDQIKLNDAQKMAVSMRMFGETFTSIGEKLGCDAKRARSIFHHAMSKIRKHKVLFENFK